jgi:hypothetical protein
VKHRRLAAWIVTSSRAPALAALPLALAACAGPPITSPIDGEPVCADFESGAAHSKMIGGLRHPVQLTIKNGTNAIFKTTLSGLRTDKDLATRVLIADADETLTLEWAQCANERAARPQKATGQEAKGAAKYECGEATVYKTEQLVTKKGDPKSHAITFPAPPDPSCWLGTAPTPEPADAGAPDAATGSADAGEAPAADADAGATDAGATDAGATDAASPDAGATDAGAKGASTAK